VRHKIKEHFLTIDRSFDCIRCPACGLAQFCTSSTICKRCRQSLGIRYVTLPLLRRNPEKNSLEECTRDFGHMIRSLRRERGMTQAECAVYLHTSRSHLSRLESGRLSPSFYLLFRTAQTFAVDRVIFRIRIPRTSPSKS
jgi:ribosome-binding protein aMBF1 (putative translation factor)